MTKDEFDSIEEGDEAELAGQWYTLKSASTGWTDLSGVFGCSSHSYPAWGSVRKKAAPTNASDGWYMEAGKQIELRPMTNAAGFHVHGADGKKLFDISYGRAVQYIQKGVWVKQPTPGKLFGIDGRGDGKPFKVGDVIRTKGPDSITAKVTHTTGAYFTVRYEDIQDRTYDLAWEEAQYFVLRKFETKPKISDYPHRCDCGSPAFANFLTVDCQAKCSKPNVRNV